MSDTFAVELRNTGATSYLAEQDKQELSLGGYCSSSLTVNGKDIRVVGLPPKMRIQRVSDDTENGVGELRIIKEIGYVPRASWKSPNGVFSSEYNINNYSPTIIKGTSGYIHIESYLYNTEYIFEVEYDVTINISIQNVSNYSALSMGEVSETLTASGGATYRSIGLFLHNRSLSSGKVYLPPLGTPKVTDDSNLSGSGAGNISTSSTLRDFPMSGYFMITDNTGTLKEVVYATRSVFGYDVEATHRGLLGTSAVLGTDTDLFVPVPPFRLAIETPTSDQIAVSPDEHTPPAGITYATAFSEATAVAIPNIALNSWVGVHLERVTVAGELCLPHAYIDIKIWEPTLNIDYMDTGRYAVANDEVFSLWVSDTAPLDFNSDPTETNSTLSFNYALTPPSSGMKFYYYAIKKTNRFGLTSFNTYTRKIGIDASGGEFSYPPSSPTNINISNGYCGSVHITLDYDRGEDGDLSADRWLVWISDTGVAPDPDTDPYTAVFGLPEVSYVGDKVVIEGDAGEYPQNTALKIVIKVMRSSDGVMDENTTVYDFTTATVEPPVNVITYN